MGGTLTATSVVGEGATFTLDLALADEPVDERDDTPAGRGAAAQRVRGQARPGAGAGVPARLILLDLHLPGIDGEEVLRRLRADQRTADVPVVMVSADVTPWHRERLLEAGAAEYLTKPLDVPRFLDVIDGILVAAHP